MALINIKFFSDTLGRQTDINVIIPQRTARGEIGIKNVGADGKYKTLLLLHGLSDDCTIWARRTSIERYATEHGIAVVMPSAERSFYTDMRYGDRFYTYISKEVLKVARDFLPLSERREDNFVAGNSMGGYGALKIALKNPECFSAAAGLSSVADIKLFMTKHRPALRELIYGDSIADSEDLFALATEHSTDSVKARIYTCVGKDDFMYEENLRLKKHFESLDYDYTYDDGEGTHEWGYWDKNIKPILDWMLK